VDFKTIKRIIDMTEEANISSLAVETEGMKIEVKKEFSGHFSAQPLMHHMPSPMHNVASHPAPAAEVKAETPKAEDQNLVAIKSPMVGTFYASQNPESPAFVKIGDQVNSGQIVCIVEAMKIFNEIESEVTGVIEKICVANATPVEYGQELFLVRKNA
jgi:acetyl-CoA carboxylase biotin carboxyl carrier protein